MTGLILVHRGSDTRCGRTTYVRKEKKKQSIGTPDAIHRREHSWERGVWMVHVVAKVYSLVQDVEHNECKSSKIVECTVSCIEGHPPTMEKKDCHNMATRLCQKDLSIGYVVRMKMQASKA